MTAELTSLAHHCFEINKYCPETCCVVGNYYSIRSEHDKAIVYFQRAVKLNPNNSGAYTLMGHEFMEFKNTSAACLAYRKALQIDPKDFRAWYGLGQVYDILKMSTYAIYYYNMAHKARPQDSRMIMALGDMYEKHQKFDDAKRCFWKAHCVADMDGLALLKLGKLYEKMNDQEQAAASYSMFLKYLEEKGVSGYLKLNNVDHQPGCYRFLAEYCVNRNQLDEAYNYAQLCLEFDSTKEEAKGILRRISQLRTCTPTNDESPEVIEVES
uniref:Uncharacterized protein n=1 Tax=Romanomermis culicivorax TaxID=13658 RepID=A0A915ISH5_ROMCU